MKDTYTLIAYMASGSYGGCRCGCTPSSHYDSELLMFAFDGLDALMEQAYNIHTKHLKEKSDKDKDSYYEFHALLNGKWISTFCFGQDTSSSWFQDYTQQDDNTDEYWEGQKVTENLQNDIERKVGEYRKTLKEQEEKRVKEKEEAHKARILKEKQEQEAREKELLRQLQEKYKG